MAKRQTQQFWMAVHRYLGLTAMAFLFIAASTGVLLSFDHALDAALNPDLFRSPERGAPLATVAAIARFEKTHPTLKITGFPILIPAGHTIEAKVAARAGAAPPPFDEVFVAPQDGRLVGTRVSGPGWGRRHLIAGVYRLHFTLLAGDWGRRVMGGVALLWLIGNGVGLYLTMPMKRPFWRKWRRAWRIDWRGRLRWLLVDVHRASGLWMFVGVTMLALTSVCMNFFDEAFWPAVSSLSPPRASLLDDPAPARPGPDLIGFEGALGHAQDAARARGWRWTPASEAYLPDRNVYQILFTPSGRVTYRWLGPVKLYVDGRTGALVDVDDAYTDSVGRKLNRILYPLHTGQVIGPAGIAIDVLLALATVEMCVTGGYVWWKKRQSRRAMDRSKREAAQG